MAGDYNKLEGVLTIPTSVVLGEGDNQKLLEIRLCRQVVRTVKAAFEDWLELSARRRIAHLRKQLGEDGYSESMAEVTKLSASGGLRWGGPAWQKAIFDTHGVLEMIVLLAHEAGQKELTHSTVGKVLNNLTDFKVLLEALKEVYDSSPNFIEPPPMKGED